MSSIISLLSPAQIAQLTTTAIQSLQTTDIAALSTSQAAALTSTQVNAMGTVDLQYLAGTQVAALSTAVVSALLTLQFDNDFADLFEVRGERPQLAQRVAHGVGRLPGEPADDAALGVQHRLDLSVILGRIGLKAKVLQARSALDGADTAGFQPGKIGARIAQVLDGAEQSGAPLQVLALIDLMHQGIADNGAEKRGADHEQRKRRHKTWRPHAALQRRPVG